MRNIFLLLLGLVAPLQAHYCGIEFLYFKPTIDQSYYAISSSNNTFAVPGRAAEFFPDGKRFNNDPSFHPGVRVEGIFCDADLRFAYFSESHSDHVSGPFLFDTIGFPGDGAQRPEDTSYDGTASYRQIFNYYGVDGTFNRLSFSCCPENFYFLTGLHFAYLKVAERTRSDGTSINTDRSVATVTNRLIRNSNFWGLGPQLGLDYRYCFGPLSLKTNARASLLVSHTWADFHYHTVHTGPVGVNITNESSWRINPCADVKVGLNYECQIKCCRTSFELGYEMIWYSKAVDAITGYDVAFAGDSFDLFSNFNLQGPYLAVGVHF